MSVVFEVTKDPSAILDYGFDWTAWLGADTVSTSSWSVSSGSGLVITSTAVDSSNKKTVVWLAGGNLGGIYTVSNLITTVAGRQDSRSFSVTVLSR